MDFTYDKYSAPKAIEKIEILGALFELPAKQHCQLAPRISIFSIAMGADYSFYVEIIETHARAFFKVIIFSIGIR